MVEEQINISDGVGVKVEKAEERKRPKQQEKVLDPDKGPETNETVEFTQELKIYKELKEYLERRCILTKLSMKEVLSSLILDAARVHYNRGCPYCLPERLDKQKRRNENLRNLKKKKIEKEKIKERIERKIDERNRRIN